MNGVTCSAIPVSQRPDSQSRRATATCGSETNGGPLSGPCGVFHCESADLAASTSTGRGAPLVLLRSSSAVSSFSPPLMEATVSRRPTRLLGVCVSRDARRARDIDRDGADRRRKTNPGAHCWRSRNDRSQCSECSDSSHSGLLLLSAASSVFFFDVLRLSASSVCFVCLLRTSYVCFF